MRYVCGTQQRAARSCVGELSVRAAELVNGCSALTAGVLVCFPVCALTSKFDVSWFSRCGSVRRGGLYAAVAG